jgi:hypothetical protein
VRGEMMELWQHSVFGGVYACVKRDGIMIYAGKSLAQLHIYII